MAKGEQFPAEWRTFSDQQTGIQVRQLTNYKGHSHHLYFTNPGWYDNNRKLLCGSDRCNRTNLFSIDLTTSSITQLTDLDQLALPLETDVQGASINPQHNEVYFWHGRSLLALDLHTLKERVL